MFRKKIFFVLFIVLIFASCVKKSNRKLGVDYYKMSSFELEEGRADTRTYRKSLNYINKALNQDFRAEYLAHKATLLFLLGKEQDSLDCFSQALKMPVGPSIRAEILNNYACLIAKTGDKKNALKLFGQLEGDKNYLTPEVALVNQAKIYYEGADYENARKKLCRAVSVAPDYVDAHYYLGLVCYALRDYEIAMISARKAISLEPEHEGAKLLLNWCS